MSIMNYCEEICYTLQVRLPLHLCLVQAVHNLIDPLFDFDGPNLQNNS